MRLGVFGGTFDPPHRLHKALVQAALATGLLDAVHVFPAASPPHKLNQVVWPAGYRLEMTKRLFADLSAVSVLDQELDRSGPSYTYLLLEELHQTFQKRGESLSLFFIMGADSLLQFESWKNPTRILSLATLFVARRPGIDPLALELVVERLRAKGGKIQFFDAPFEAVSSTAIRSALEERLAHPLHVPEGRIRTSDPLGLQDLPLTPAVLSYILDHGLYAYPNWGAELSGETYQFCNEVERKLRRALSPKRYQHSLNVFSLTVAFAASFGISVDLAARAALLHDCAKDYGEEDLLACLPEVVKSCESIVELYHGPVGAHLAKTIYGETHPAVLQTIALHSTLAPGCTDLDELVFVCDKVEPGREYRDLPPLRELLLQDLHRAAEQTARSITAILERDQKPNASLARGYLDWCQAGRPNLESNLNNQYNVGENLSRHDKQEEMFMQSENLAKRIESILVDKKGQDIQTLDVMNKTTLADYFILASGTSTPHVKSLADEVEYVLKQEGILPKQIEGRETGRWILLDYGDVVVHVFHHEERSFYSLETLWRGAKPLSE